MQAFIFVVRIAKLKCQERGGGRTWHLHSEEKDMRGNPKPGNRGFSYIFVIILSFFVHTEDTGFVFVANKGCDCRKLYIF